MIAHLDHLVLTTRDLAACLSFYVDILGLTISRFGQGRIALHWGTQKMNIHCAGQEHAPHAEHPTPGSLDLCFLLQVPLTTMIAHLVQHHITIECGPIQRTGTLGPIQSIYIRDPDSNLIELSEPLY